MPPKLSVIIPVYNCEKYLDECVSSVLAQTFTDFELILVDDGSTDQSPRLCDDYALRFPDKIRVIHKQNGGAASARNAGLDAAKGEYIGFIDSDDTILPGMFACIMENIAKHHVDIVETKFILPGSKTNHENEPQIVSGREALIEMFNWRVSTSLCTKVFRKKTISGILMNEGHINEDFRFLCDVFVRNPKVCILQQAFYKYRPTPGSVTRVMRPNFFDIFTNLDYIRTLLPPSDKQLQKYFRHYAMTMHIMSGVKIVKGRHNSLYKKWLRENRKFIRNHFAMLLGPSPLSLRWRLKALFAFLRLP